MLAVAEKYHVLPDAVEHMDSYWFERAVEFMKGEHLYHEGQNRKREREQNRPRRR